MNARQLIEVEYHGGDYGSEFDMGWRGEPDKHTYPANYKKEVPRKPIHRHEQLWADQTDGEMVDALQDHVDRLGGLVERGEVPDYNLRNYVLTAMEMIDKALEICDDF